MSLKIFIVAGEPSGDALGGPLIKALRDRMAVPPVITGVGGPLMIKNGLRSLHPMEDLCVMGLFEILKHAPRLLKLVKKIALEIERQNPDLLITIDLPDFNFRVAKLLKKRGLYKGKIIHYVAPTVWAWRPGRAAKVAKFLDGVICLFPFEPPYFTPHELPAEFCGHPLVENKKPKDGAHFRQKHNIPEHRKTLGLFFGSRHTELLAIRNVFRDTVKILTVSQPDLHLIIPTLPHLKSGVRQILSTLNCSCTILTDPDEKWQSFGAMDAALAMSGTIGLELAYAGVPHVIAYRANPLSWQLFKRLARVRYAHLANIMMDRPVIPEYLQTHCNAPEISQGLIKLMESNATRNAQITTLKEIGRMLGTDDPLPPSSRAADFVLKIYKCA